MTQPAEHPACAQCAQTAALAADLLARVNAIAPVIVAAYEAEGRPEAVPAILRRPVAVTSRRASLIALPGGAA